MKQQKGIALLVVLWVLVAIVIIAMTYSQGIRTEVLLASNVRNHSKAVNLAENGVIRGAAIALSARVQTDNSILDGRITSLSTDDGSLYVSLQSTDGLVDLNRAPAEVLNGLFNQFSDSFDLAKSMTDALLDWRDEDDFRRTNGAERAEYAYEDYPVKNGLLNSVDEFRRVKGVSQHFFDQVFPFITVYSGQARTAIQTAPKEVLVSLPGINQENVDTILEIRAKTGLKDYLSIVPAETKHYIGAGTNEYVRISSFAEVNGIRAGVIAVIKLEPVNDSPVMIVSWREQVASIFD